MRVGLLQTRTGAAWVPCTAAFLAVGLVLGSGCTSSTAPSTATVPAGLWITSYTSNNVVRYSSSQLTSSTSAAAATTITISAINTLSVALDASGNLWVATFSPGGLLKYSGSQLGASGSPTPVVFLTVPFNPFPIAFDRQGNLWVANAVGSTVVEYAAGQLMSSGSPTPAVTIGASSGSLNGPDGLAFDVAGNLWVANSSGNTVVEFVPGQLAASGTPAPNVTLTASASSIHAPEAIAFDADGNLWVANIFGQPFVGTLVEFSASQLTTTGSPTPPVTLTTNAGSLVFPGGLAFDGSGNLWVANGGTNGPVVEFSASQIVASGSPAPTVVLSGQSLSAPFGLAFAPIPAGLPLKQ